MFPQFPVSQLIAAPIAILTIAGLMVLYAERRPLFDRLFHAPGLGGVIRRWVMWLVVALTVFDDALAIVAHPIHPLIVVISLIVQLMVATTVLMAVWVLVYLVDERRRARSAAAARQVEAAMNRERI